MCDRLLDRWMPIDDHLTKTVCTGRTCGTCPFYTSGYTCGLNEIGKALREHDKQEQGQ